MRSEKRCGEFMRSGRRNAQAPAADCDYIVTLPT